MSVRSRFPSPYTMECAPEAKGWQSYFPYYSTFQKVHQTTEENRFWYCDAQHWPTVISPFDWIAAEFAYKTLSQFNSRHYIVPPANGLDYRVHNGYFYVNPVAVDPKLIAGRVPKFMERAGYYFQNWPTLLENWHRKMRAAIADIGTVEFNALPDEVPIDWIREGRGLDPTTELLENYEKSIQLTYRVWQYHFEFLNLGYAAYLDFFSFCKEQFPGIPDQAVARMVQGIEVDLFRPDDELKKLARLAIALGVDSALLNGGNVEEALAAVGKRPKGAEWLKAWNEAQDPWFNFTSGNGFFSSDKYWIEHLDIPMGYLRDYIRRAKNNEKIERPTAEIAAERDRITSEYAATLQTDHRDIFQQKLGLARTVFPYVENHNFYVEHWFMGVFWRKMRELSRLLSDAGFWPQVSDMFLLNRNEVRDCLFDYCNAWAVGVEPIGPKYWEAEIQRRRKIFSALAACPPQPAFNEPPESITEPFTIMLFGITSESVSAWLSGKSDSKTLIGMAASPGRVEGPARVIRSPEELDQVLEGEILVAPVTAPSWAPVFCRIKATVTDIGGIMSHAAIVCREYGLPAVTATGSASTTIKNGQMLRVDGHSGEVTILS
jgi:pyruvate,water dikinase